MFHLLLYPMMKISSIALLAVTAAAKKVTEFELDGLTSGGGFAAYPGYEGPLSLKGRMLLRFDDASGNMTLAHELQGVERACADGGDAAVANSCGVHIHEGTSCDGPDLVVGCI